MQDGLHGEVSKRGSLHLLLPYAQLQADNVTNVCQEEGGVKVSEVVHILENAAQTIVQKSHHRSIPFRIIHN